MLKLSNTKTPSTTKSWIFVTSPEEAPAGVNMEVQPIAGICLGLEHITNPYIDDPEEEWVWAYVLNLFIVRFSFIKYK